MEIKIAETAMAVMQGADEIDVVMNLGYFLEENYDELSEEIQEIKESCRDAKLKVILETGALQTPESIQKAAVLAVYSGADFIKTSTGKGYPGATPEAVYTMCQVLKSTIPSRENVSVLKLQAVSARQKRLSATIPSSRKY